MEQDAEAPGPGKVTPEDPELAGYREEFGSVWLYCPDIEGRNAAAAVGNPHAA
jgi:hypothetical protein